MPVTWLTFPEAAALIRDRSPCSTGTAEKKVREALASGEVRCGFTAAAIAEQENAAHQELTQAAEQDAFARGFKMSGSALDILRSRAQREANSRATRRLALKPDFNDPSFSIDLASGNIQISATDLSHWLARTYTSTPPKKKKPKHRYPGDAALIREGRRLIKGGGMSNLKAAQQLAPKAGGGTLEQRVERLRKLLA